MLSYRMASIGSRALAHLLDLLMIVIMLTVVSLAAGYFQFIGRLAESAFNTFLAVLWSLGPFAYFILFEGFWNGQTLGKKAAGIRVRMADATPITFGAALGRNLLRPADLMPGTYFAGIITMFVNPRSQRLGDILANTIVVHEKRPEPIFAPAPHIVGFHPLEPQVGELKGMTMEEYIALKRLCDRFPELTHNVQMKMMREVWDPIARRYGLDGIRNVHPLHVAEAVVMRYGRTHGLL